LKAERPFGCVFGELLPQGDEFSRAAQRGRQRPSPDVEVNRSNISRWALVPNGGVRESGAGHEGLRYGTEEMTHPRILVLTGVVMAS
jgi:acyl-CoA reductase-like NAD-dependent aldehyde dehydrogenase